VVVEYMRAVIENGVRFSNNHYFILLLGLDIRPEIMKYLKVIHRELGVSNEDFTQFVSGVRDKVLAGRLSDLN
jgi:hypothetical protein